MQIRGKILIVLLCFLLPVYSNSQDRSNFRVSAISEISNYNNGTLTSYGFSVEYFIHHNFSFNYQYTFGINQFKNTYIHYPGGVAGLVELFRTDSYYLYSTSGDDGWSYIMLLAIILPEGVSFHTYPRKWLELAPFVNPFSTDFNIMDNKRSTITLSLGLKAHIKPTYNLSISPHFGIKHIYANGKVGTFMGISAGFLF
jgi:hypothetical protein